MIRATAKNDKERATGYDTRVMLIIWIILFILLVSFAYAAVRGAPWVPTRRRDLDRLIKLLDVKPGQKIYELGCGDGRVSILIGKKTGATVVGVELSLAQFIVACIRRVLSHLPNVYFSFGDVFSVNLADADAVYLFLMPKTYAKIRAKLERELRPGTKVITYVWPMDGWTPREISSQAGSENIYLYVR